MSTTIAKKEEAPNAVATAERTWGGVAYSPRFDIWETDDELILCGDLPGVAPGDLDVRYENRVLTVHGKVQPRHQGIEFLHGEYGIGDFDRTFTIGESIDPKGIRAELKGGVVMLHLPKVEAVKPRRIEVKTV